MIFNLSMLSLNVRRIVGGGGGGGAAATMNPLDKHANITLTNGNLTVTKNAGGGAWHSVRSQNSHNDGFYYVECKDNTFNVGQIMGFQLGSGSLSQFPGQSTDGVGWYYTNTSRQMIYNSATVNSGGAGAGAGQYGGLAIRIDAATGAVRVWGRTSNVAGWLGGGNPSANTLPTYSFSITAGAALYFSVALYGSTEVADVNLGSSAFNMAIPVGALPWIDTAGIPPSYADPYWPNVVLLVSGEGTNGSTVFTDMAGRHTVTTNGMTQVSTADGSFPNGAIDTDGSGSDYLAVTGNNDDWVFGTGPFTVETNFKLDAAASGGGAYFLSNYAGAGAGWALHIMPGSGSVRFLLGSTNIVRTFTFVNGTFYHLEVTRDSAGDVRFFVNGTQVGATDTTTLDGVTVGSNAQHLVMGAEGTPYTAFGQWDGRQAWARVTAGVARHTSNFTPPTFPYPTV